jgi:hypothetical protein
MIASSSTPAGGAFVRRCAPAGQRRVDQRPGDSKPRIVVLLGKPRGRPDTTALTGRMLPATPSNRITLSPAGSVTVLVSLISA